MMVTWYIDSEGLGDLKISKKLFLSFEKDPTWFFSLLVNELLGITLQTHTELKCVEDAWLLIAC